MHGQPQCKSKVENLERQETELFKANWDTGDSK